MEFKVVDPFTEQAVATYSGIDDPTVDQILRDADEAQREWARAQVSDRVEVLRSIATRLRADRERLADLMTREMGKRTAEGLAEIDKCAWVCDYYAEQGPAFLAPEPIPSDAGTSYVSYRPLGIILAVMPWNFPFWQVLRFTAPALLAGNGAVLKHAPNVPGCALAIEELIRNAVADAGFDGALLRALLISEAQTARVIADPRVRGVTLTGSTRAGRAVAELAGRNLKKTVLELGGSDPYVVLADADVERAAEACVTSRLINGGQSCIAAKRWIVVGEVYDAFEARVSERLAAVQMGDPRREDVQLGPMARRDLRDELHRQVTESMDLGAGLKLGGTLPPGPGFLYPATLLTDVRPGMPAFDEELFGPVAALIRAEDEASAVVLANQSSFGLGAAVFSRDEKRAEEWARDRLEAGCCFVNDFVRSDPRLPFGGIRDSGYGRELSGHGLREWVNAKTVWVR